MIDLKSHSQHNGVKIVTKALDPGWQRAEGGSTSESQQDMICIYIDLLYIRYARLIDTWRGLSMNVVSR